jgi:putative transposase
VVLVAAGFSLRHKQYERKHALEEKKHRLSREYYQGRVSAAFTLCIRGKEQAFTDEDVVNAFIEILRLESRRGDCFVPAYCFMPDHQHVLLFGMADNSDVWNVMVRYKQRTGYWLSRNRPPIKWQKDFYDHILRNEESLASQVRYILDNPVRKGLVETWKQYPFLGSIGCELDGVVQGLL